MAMAFFQRLLDWVRSLFWKEEMELTLVGLQNSGKTTFVNVIAVSCSDNCEKGRLQRVAGVAVTFVVLRFFPRCSVGAI